MKKFFERLFGAKKSNTEKGNAAQVVDVPATEVVDIPAPRYTVDKLVQAIRKDDIDYIIEYVKAGEDINETFTITRRDSVDNGLDWYEWEEHTLPLNFAHNSDIKEYLVRHGAITYEELMRRRKLEEDEARQLRDKEREEEEKLRAIEKEKEAEYIRQRIAEADNLQN